MKRKDVYELAVVLAELEKEDFCVKLSYALAKTHSGIKAEVEAIEKARKPTEEYQEYDTKRAELAKLHAKKDDSDAPIIAGGGYVIANQTGFSAALDELSLEYPEAIEGQKTRVEDFKEFLEEDTEIKVHQVDFEYLPDTFASGPMRVLLDAGVLRPPKEE